MTLPAIGSDDVITQTDMNQWSVMQRLWSGVSRRSVAVESDSTPLALALSQLAADVYLFTLCRLIFFILPTRIPCPFLATFPLISYPLRDIRLRIWSLNSKECIHVIPLSFNEELKADSSNLICFKPATEDSPAMLAVHLSFVDGSAFKVYSVSCNNDKLTLTLTVECSGLEIALTHFNIHGNQIVALFNECGAPRVLTMDLENVENEWNEVQMIELPEVDMSLFDDPIALVDMCLVEFSELTLWTALSKLGYEAEELNIEDAMDGFVKVHIASDDLENVLPLFYEEVKTYHTMHSTPMFVADGLVVMEGDVSILRPNSSDVYLSGDKYLAEALLVIVESIPAEEWQSIQEVNQSTHVVDVAKNLITDYLQGNDNTILKKQLQEIRDPSRAFLNIIKFVNNRNVLSCQLPYLFKNTSGKECLAHAVDEGIYDAHKTYAVLLVCLLYIDTKKILNDAATLKLVNQTLIPSCVDILNQFSLLTWVISKVVEPSKGCEIDEFGGLNISGDGQTKNKTILHYYLSARQPQVNYTDLKDLNKMVVTIIDVMYPGSPLLDLPLFLLSSQYYKELLEVSFNFHDKFHFT